MFCVSVSHTRIPQAYPAFQLLALSASYVAANSSLTGITTATPSWPWAMVRATRWSGWRSGQVVFQLNRDIIIVTLWVLFNLSFAGMNTSLALWLLTTSVLPTRWRSTYRTTGASGDLSFHFKVWKKKDTFPPHHVLNNKTTKKLR